MDSVKNDFTNLADDLRGYVETTVEIYKLQATEKIADLVAGMMINIILLVVVSMAFLFFSLAAAFLIGRALGETYWGFLIVAGFYALLGLVIHLMKNKGLKNSIADGIIHSIHKS